MKKYDTIAETKYDGLVAHATPAPLVFSVVLEKGSAARSLKRGTILTKTKGEEEGIAYAILADDVTVGTEEDVVCTAYRTGHFNRKAMITKDGTTLGAVDEEELRKGGILLSDALYS